MLNAEVEAAESRGDKSMVLISFSFRFRHFLSEKPHESLRLFL